MGVAGQIYRKEDLAFKDLLLIDALRGDHSTGVLFAPRSPNFPPYVLKKATDPTWFLYQKEVHTAFKEVNMCLLGHNRYATVGNIDDTNAHPFAFKSIVGAHNGTLHNKGALVDSETFDVDSANLFHSIEKVGLEETYELIQGAWSLTWWHTEENSLHFLRNEKRPLSYCFSKDRKSIFWASEAAMLILALSRRSIDYTEIVQTKPHHFYTFKIPAFGKTISDIKIVDMTPKVVPFVKKTSKFSSKSKEYFNKYFKERRDFVVTKKTLNEYGQTFLDGQFCEYPHEAVKVYFPKRRSKELERWQEADILTGKVTHCSLVTGTYFLSPHKLCIAEIEETVEGFEGELLTYSVFHENAKSGCAWCGSPMFYGDPVLWLGRREAMCEDCTHLSDTQEYIKDLT